MSKIHIGPHTHDQETDPHPAEQTFDREVNLKAVAWTVGILVAVALVVHVLVYGLIVGFNRFDDKREPRPSPVPAANEQPKPPLPWLQTSPELELKSFRAEEERLLGGIDRAMEEIARRGLGPEVVGGTPGAVVLVPPPVQQPQTEATPPPAQERR